MTTETEKLVGKIVQEIGNLPEESLLKCSTLSCVCPMAKYRKG
jgi:hypothetical protein